MIKIKSAHEISLMRQAGRLAAEARALAGSLVEPGITTREIDHEVRRFLKNCGSMPSFLGYGGFPAAICCSVNDEVIHGIPGSRKIKEGDLVKIDVGAIYHGYHGDCAATFAAGAISPEAQRLLDVTRQSFYEGIKQARPGQRISDISRAVQVYNEERGYSLVREYVGHGIGSEMHEEPEVPNYVSPRARARLVAGMTLAVEPMVNQGGYEVRRLRDGWTVVTADGKLSAHYENTILITDGDPEILTVAGGQHNAE